MKQAFFEILSNEKLAKDVFRLVLSGDTDGIKPGQFVNVLLENKYLRRPVSVCDADGKKLTLIYKVVGSGTAELSGYVPGKALDILTVLGNGYDLSLSGERPLLIGGGVGVPPLYYLAKELKKQGKSVSVILGFNAKDEIFYENEFKELGCGVKVTTVDGSYGIKGFVTDALEDGYTYVYTCGPKPMLKAVNGKITTSGQFSLEERMGCGFGACMGCSVKTEFGTKRLCKDGPVLFKEEIIW